MRIQQSLFGTRTVDAEFDRNVERHRFKLEEIDIGDITFQSGQSESVHRWYRLTPSFAPGLVRFFLKEFGITADSRVLDPFSGRGTTVIECQKYGIPAIGFEINPLLQLVGSHSLDWNPPEARRLGDFTEFLHHTLESHKNDSIDSVAAALGAPIPDIHDVYRWWKEFVLRDLMVAKWCMLRDEFAPIRSVLSVALADECLDCANIHRNHPTITFDDDHDREICVADELERKLSEIRADLTSLSTAQAAASRMCSVRLCNSCSPSPDDASAAERATHVITSPPYPNRYSYVHQTRPQLHFMGLVRSRRCATDIDLETIGGTWGAATSALMKALIEPPQRIRPLLTYFEELSGRSTLMCNYATKYFLDLDTHLRNIRPILQAGARCAYIVGNSRLSNVEIYTETILARLFELNGYEVERIIIFRKRGGRKRLYETAVIARA